MQVAKNAAVSRTRPPASLLQRKMIYSTGEVKLAMKLLLGQKNEAEQVRRSFFSKDEGDGDKFVPVNEETIEWAYHVLDRMVFEPHWRIHIC